MDEVSPSYLRDGVEFQVRLRGYDAEQVDEFLDRVAGGIELLQQQLRQALERAARAEQQAAENTEADQALRRTLVMAQKAADLATQEAETAAERLRADAEADAARIVAEAETAAARAASKGQRDLRADIRKLEEARRTLEADVAALEAHLEEEKGKLRALLTEQLARLEAALPMAPAPAVRPVKVPPEPVEPEPEPELDADDEDEDEIEGDEEDESVEIAESVGLVEPDEPEIADDESDDLSEEDDDEDVDEDEIEADDEVDDHTTALPDPFLDELRKAATDEAPLGPRDHVERVADGEAAASELDLPDRSRWGRRRRR